MKITMLGTGNAGVKKCFNTCFIIEDSGRYMLVDTGGGNRLLTQLDMSEKSIYEIRDIFISHRHTDHLTGIFWIARSFLQQMRKHKVSGHVNIYAHNEVINILNTTISLLFPNEAEYINNGFNLIEVKDGEERSIIGHNFTFFDINSKKAKQFGFSMELNKNDRLVFCGDEPCPASGLKYVNSCTWLMHEAFCLCSEADIFKPYDKKHSTVKDACMLAENSHVKNLILYHTEEKNLEHRKELYTAEGQKYFSGNLFVPDDLETINL